MNSYALCVLHITSACNLRCKHCYASAGKKRPDEMTMDEIRSVIDQIHDMGINYVTVSGGEPLMHEHFYEILEYISKRNMNTMITTNGTLLDDGAVKRIKALGVDSVQISLDSPVAETHDRFRGLQGAFQRSVEGVRLCKENGLKVSIMSTLSEINKNSVQELLDFAYSLRPNGIAIERFVPEGRGSAKRELGVSGADLRRCLELLNAYSEKYPDCKFSTNDPLAVFVGNKNRYALQAVEEGMPLCGGCSIGRMAFGITPVGEVVLCTRLYQSVGSIRDAAISDILHDSVLVNRLCDRSNLKGRCGKCRYKCICGGCRGWAYGSTGDHFESDSLCWLTDEEIGIAKA